MRQHFSPPPFHPNRPSLVAPVRLDPDGTTGPTRGQAKGKQWRQTSYGLYVPDDVESTVVEQRIVEAASVLPPGGGAVTGWAALRWLDARWLDGTLPGQGLLAVDLAVRGTLRPKDGINLCEEGLDPREVIVVDGLPITIAPRSVCFAMRYADTCIDAVRVFDMAAFNDLVSKAEMWAFAGPRPRTRLSSWTGMPQYREALVLGNENAWSPREVDMRMIWVTEADLPPPLCNVPIFDLRGNLIGTPDILDVEAGVAGEYNGELHLEGAQHARDVRREEAFRNVGLECFTMLAGDSRDRGAMAERMIAARGRALWLPAGERAWTTTPPPWWTPTLTVEQRRALTESQRARWLKNRAA